MRCSRYAANGTKNCILNEVFVRLWFIIEQFRNGMGLKMDKNESPYRKKNYARSRLKSMRRNIDITGMLKFLVRPKIQIHRGKSEKGESEIPKMQVK